MHFRPKFILGKFTHNLDNISYTWYARIFAKLANTGSVANANVSEHSSTGWIICRICTAPKKRLPKKTNGENAKSICVFMPNVLRRIRKQKWSRGACRLGKRAWRQINGYLWMSETLQLLNRISQNLGNGLFSLRFVKFFGASFLKNKYRTFLKCVQNGR